MKIKLHISEGNINRLDKSFFTRDVLDVAPDLLGKNLVTSINGSQVRLMINEVEAYRGSEDKACHACKGRTPRTEILYHEGGHIYVYFIYGMYWMLNIVTGSIGNPQAVLIRGLGQYNGPGKLTKALGIDRSFYGEDLTKSGRIWVEETGIIPDIKTGPRIGVEYAGDYWKSLPWRFFIPRGSLT